MAVAGSVWGSETGVAEGTQPKTGPHAEWMRPYLRGLILLDAASGAAAGCLAVALRFPEAGATPAAAPYWVISAVLPLLWVACVATGGGYERRFVGVGTEEFRRVASTGVVLTAGVAVLSYLFMLELARGYILVTLPAVTLFSLGARYWWRKRLHRRRAAGRCMRRVVVVGHRTMALGVLRQLRREPYHGMLVVGVCLPAEQCAEQEGRLGGVAVLGDFGEVARGVARAQADTVAVLSCPEMGGVALRRLAWQLEKIGADLTVAPALMDVAGPRTSIRPVAGLPLLHVDHPRLDGWTSLVKGVFDRVAALLALVVLAPLIAALAVAIRRDSPGPVFFTQTRVGRGGALFTVYKLRTMVPGAERQRERLAVRNEQDGVLFKIRRDPRVTRVGVWLRRYSLDELPQLFNVLLGHMSLVGPRPPLPEEAAQYRDDVRRRLVVKPGMTGLWQVSGRSDLSWEESVRLDLRYVENWSLTLDVQILWKTWTAVLRGAGAY